MTGWEDIALRLRRVLFQQWIPAFAGMTGFWGSFCYCRLSESKKQVIIWFFILFP
jgi:hypothetical protein